MAAKNKTVETGNSVAEYVNAIADETKRKDSAELIELIKTSTGLEPRMWGPGIVGFGSYHYKYESGREGDAPLVGMAARVNSITLYVTLEARQREDLLQQLGKHKISKGCIYIKKLEDVNKDVISKMATLSVEYMKRLYP